MLKKTPRLSRRCILSRINRLKWDKYHGALEGDWTGTITLATSLQCCVAHCDEVTYTVLTLLKYF